MANSLDPDETPRSAASYLDPNCLQISSQIGLSSERVEAAIINKIIDYYVIPSIKKCLFVCLFVYWGLTSCSRIFSPIWGRPVVLTPVPGKT